MGRFAALLFAALLAGCATTPQPSGPPLQVSEVIPVKGRSAEQLCNSARDWTAKTFRDSNAVVEVFDAERGKLIGKGYLQIPIIWGSAIPVQFTMTVDCKDGRLRAAFDGYTTEYGGVRYPLVEDEINKLQTKARASTMGLIAQLREYLSSPPKNDF